MSSDGGATERLKVGGEVRFGMACFRRRLYKPGAEGVTPQLKVSADGGVKLVSLDGGRPRAAFANGQPVNALGIKSSSVTVRLSSVTYDATTGLWRSNC